MSEATGNAVLDDLINDVKATNALAPVSIAMAVAASVVGTCVSEIPNAGRVGALGAAVLTPLATAILTTHGRGKFRILGITTISIIAAIVTITGFTLPEILNGGQSLFGHPGGTFVNVTAVAVNKHRSRATKPIPDLYPGAPLEPNATGQDVDALQRQLNIAMNVGLKVDGKFGSDTEQAVRALQEGTCIADTGIVDAPTWNMLFGPVDKSHDVSNFPHQGCSFSIGLRSKHGLPGVALIQQRLNQNDDASLNVDGSFGPRTFAAVKTLQAAHGLQQDGVVGQKTWAALFSSKP